ncbi:unnamed protein product, partial [Hapterophycus canaliculatus]
QGIPLGAVVAATLAERHNRDVGFAFDRKEAKDHGEKGRLVGEDLEVTNVPLRVMSCVRSVVRVGFSWLVAAPSSVQA